jgi:hypothetical protein
MANVPTLLKGLCLCIHNTKTYTNTHTHVLSVYVFPYILILVDGWQAENVLNGQIWVPPAEDVAKMIEAPMLVPKLEFAAVVGEGGKEVEGALGAVVVAVVGAAVVATENKGAAVVATENKAYSVRVITYSEKERQRIHTPLILHTHAGVRALAHTRGHRMNCLRGLYLCATVCCRILEELLGSFIKPCNSTQDKTGGPEYNLAKAGTPHHRQVLCVCVCVCVPPPHRRRISSAPYARPFSLALDIYKPPQLPCTT